MARLRFGEQRFQCFVNEFSRSPVFPGCGFVFNQFTGFSIFRDSRLRVEYSCSSIPVAEKTSRLSSVRVLLVFVFFVFVRCCCFYIFVCGFVLFFVKHF